MILNPTDNIDVNVISPEWLLFPVRDGRQRRTIYCHARPLPIDAFWKDQLRISATSVPQASPRALHEHDPLPAPPTHPSPPLPLPSTLTKVLNYGRPLSIIELLQQSFYVELLTRSIKNPVRNLPPSSLTRRTYPP
jgi:hypothetical protein